MDCLRIDHLILTGGSWSGGNSFQARICSSATKDSPFIHVSTKCVLALTPGSGYFIL